MKRSTKIRIRYQGAPVLFYPATLPVRRSAGGDGEQVRVLSAWSCIRNILCWCCGGELPAPWLAWSVKSPV
jgi:hypothetical protein